MTNFPGWLIIYNTANISYNKHLLAHLALSGLDGGGYSTSTCL